MQFVEKMRVDANAHRHREVSRDRLAIRPASHDLANGNTARFSGEHRSSRPMRFHRNPQIVRQRVGGSHRNHAQRHAASSYGLQDVVDGAVASACKYRVAAFENCLPRLFRRIGTRLRAREADVHSGFGQNSLDLP